MFGESFETVPTDSPVFSATYRLPYSKYEHLRKPHITKQIIARIGHELRLRGELTEDLMVKAGFTLDVMDFKDSVLRMVIYEYVDEPIEKINQLMNQYGCLPLGSRKQVAGSR